jgi:hypothetical protein
MGSCALDFGLTGFGWVIYSAWFCIATVQVVILYCVGCWVIWCIMDAGMQKEAPLAKFEVLLLHFNKGNCGHYEEFICRRSHLYPGPPAYDARMRPVDFDCGSVDFCPEIQ